MSKLTPTSQTTQALRLCSARGSTLLTLRGGCGDNCIYCSRKALRFNVSPRARTSPRFESASDLQKKQSRRLEKVVCFVLLVNLLSHLSIDSRRYSIASLEEFDKVRDIHKEALIGNLADSRRCGAEHNPRMQ